MDVRIKQYLDTLRGVPCSCTTATDNVDRNQSSGESDADSEARASFGESRAPGGRKRRRGRPRNESAASRYSMRKHARGGGVGDDDAWTLPPTTAVQTSSEVTHKRCVRRGVIHSFDAEPSR